jgi:hypothetical protein
MNPGFLTWHRARVFSQSSDFGQREAIRWFHEYGEEIPRYKPDRPAFDHRYVDGNNGFVFLTRQTPVIVLRAQALEQRNRLRKRLHPLHRAVGHIDRRLAGAIDRPRIGAF